MNAMLSDLAALYLIDHEKYFVNGNHAMLTVFFFNISVIEAIF